MHSDVVQPQIAIPPQQAQSPDKPYELVLVKWQERTRLDGYYGGLWFANGVTDPPVQRLIAEQFIADAGPELFTLVEITQKGSEKPSAGPAAEAARQVPAPEAPARLPSPETREQALAVLGLGPRARDEEIRLRYQEMVKANPPDIRPSEYVQLVDAHRLLLGSERPSTPRGRVPAVPPPRAAERDESQDESTDEPPVETAGPVPVAGDDAAPSVPPPPRLRPPPPKG